jgi:hypothetical protein
MAMEVPARCANRCGSASRYSPERARCIRYASAIGTLRPVEALDQIRGRVRRVAALPRRGGEAVRQAGRSAIAVPRRAVDRLRPGSDPDESSPGSVEPSAFGDMVESIRDNPRVAVAIAGGTILVLAWIGWAIYVASENGASAGLGVMIAWPAMLVGLALVSLPFIGGYMLFRRLSVDETGDLETLSEGESLDPVAADADETDGDAGDEEGSEEGAGSADEGSEDGGDRDRGQDEGDEDTQTEEAAAN